MAWVEDKEANLLANYISLPFNLKKTSPGVNFINCLRPIRALRPTFAPVKSFSKVGRRAQIGRKTVYEINQVSKFDPKLTFSIRQSLLFHLPLIPSSIIY